MSFTLRIKKNFCNLFEKVLSYIFLYRLIEIVSSTHIIYRLRLPCIFKLQHLLSNMSHSEKMHVLSSTVLSQNSNDICQYFRLNKSTAAYELDLFILDINTKYVVMSTDTAPSFTSPMSTTVDNIITTGTTLETIAVTDINPDDVSSLTVTMTTHAKYSFDPSTSKSTLSNIYILCFCGLLDFVCMVLFFREWYHTIEIQPVKHSLRYVVLPPSIFLQRS